MSASLAPWLTANHTRLIERWQHETAPASSFPKSNGHSSSPNDEQHVLLQAMFDGLIEAAKGNQAALHEQMSTIRALRTTASEDELSLHVQSLFQLRDLIVDMLLEDGKNKAQLKTLIRETHQLIDTAALELTQSWTKSANAVAQQLQQAEMLAASLNEATEHADRVAVQLFNLNELSQQLSTSFDVDYLIRSIGSKLADVLSLAQVMICLNDGEGGLEVFYSTGLHALEPGALVVGGENDLIMEVYQSGEKLVVVEPDAASQGPWYEPGHAVLVAPMVRQGKSIGVVVLQDDSATTLMGSEQQSFVSSVANQAAIVLENAQLYAQVRDFNTELEHKITERTLEVQTERDMLSTLHQIALEVSSTLDVDNLLQNCLELLAQLIEVQHGSIMLIERETEQLVDRAVLGQAGMERMSHFPMGHGVAGWVAQYKKAALIADVTQDSRWQPPPDGIENVKRTGSMLAVPLVAHYDAMGVMVLSHPQTNYFTEGHLRLLNAAAGQLALGIYNALLYDQIQQELLRQGDRLRNERRSSAQSYAILQSLSDGVIVCNAEGSVLASNPAAARILERDVEELLTWQLPELIQRLLGSNSRDIPLNDVLQQPYNANGQPSHYSTTFKISTRVVSVSLDPVVLSNDEVLGAVMVFRDITREVESERMKDEFIGTVSHELRTPMTSIKGYTQLMVMGGLGPVTDMQRDFLRTIGTNAERMISIIDDLLDITKIETGSVIKELDIRLVHVAEALSNVIIDLQPKIKDREQELQVQVPLDLPLVRVDARRFNQILSNVLSNAVKYTPRQEKIIVRASSVMLNDLPEAQQENLRPGHYVRIDVIDHGVGIAAAERDLIFQRFYRTENPLKIEAGGTGLGLALVRPLVRLFGGQIWLDSEIGRGSTFSFVIPATY
jgi:signal transduction histidine kinase